MLKLLLMLSSCLLSSACISQAKEYNLISIDSNADFNYQALKYIDTTGERRNIFIPVKGQYTVYTFIANYKGWSFHEPGEIEIHDILIIKTNKHNKILDAYQYTLEWAEMPLSYDLYKSKAKGQLLTDRFPIDKLQLHRVNFDSRKGRKFKEQGVLLMPPETSMWLIFQPGYARSLWQME